MRKVEGLPALGSSKQQGPSSKDKMFLFFYLVA